MRLFVAIALPDEARAALAHFASGLPGARWVDAESLHLTLRFIGEVGRGEAEDLDAALSGIYAPAFDLAFAGLGTFGNDRAQRALWAAVAANGALDHLRDKVESAKWLIRNIEQRQQTILRIARAIVDLQYDFLDRGIEFCDRRRRIVRPVMGGKNEPIHHEHGDRSDQSPLQARQAWHR